MGLSWWFSVLNHKHISFFLSAWCRINDSIRFSKYNLSWHSSNRKMASKILPIPLILRHQWCRKRQVHASKRPFQLKWLLSPLLDRKFGVITGLSNRDNSFSYFIWNIKDLWNNINFFHGVVIKNETIFDMELNDFIRFLSIHSYYDPLFN